MTERTKIGRLWKGIFWGPAAVICRYLPWEDEYNYTKPRKTSVMTAGIPSEAPGHLKPERYP